MHKPRVIPFWPAAVILTVSAAVFAVIVLGLLKARTEEASRVAKLETENRDLRMRSQNLERDVDALRRGASLPRSGQFSSGLEEGRTRPPVDALEQAKLLIQFREKLAAANSSIEGMQARLEELQRNLDSTVQENRRLSMSEVDLKERVAATRRVLEAVQNEMRGKDERLTELEASNRRLRDESRANANKLAQVPRLLRDLEDINRRRENHLTSILRRYRDLTEQYRSLAGRLDNPHEGTMPGTSELGAIQNTISMTEEDLRQLASLNAQAVRIQQKVSGK